MSQVVRIVADLPPNVEAINPHGVITLNQLQDRLERGWAISASKLEGYSLHVKAVDGPTVYTVNALAVCLVDGNGKARGPV
jgi:hypothetical protein